MEMLSSVVKGPIFTVIPPGVQGVGVTGTQGIGVSTPNAAAVAAATSGLLGVVHIPNGIMFTNGTWSMILASGIESVNVRLIGKTANSLGAIPKLHIMVAPIQT
jgi:hypothetical protein